MKRFLIEAEVKAAEGSQTFYVDAETEEQAMDIYNNGGGNIYAHDVEVVDLGIPGCVGETSLDDFGDFPPAPQD